jgi:xanthosine utilization system XapX-like protein
MSLWDVLRALGGEINDVSAAGAEMEELRPEDALTITGHFASAGQFRVLLSPGGPEATDRLQLRGERGEAEMTQTPAGVRFRLQSPTSERSQEWANWSEGDAIADAFAGQLAGHEPPLAWQDATRCLELCEAVQRSVKRRRVVPLHYEEFTEASNFKGTMAALGCGVLVLVVGVLVALLAFRVPLRWPVLLVILPLLAIFLGLQLLRWLVPKEEKSKAVGLEDSTHRLGLGDHVIQQPHRREGADE